MDWRGWIGSEDNGNKKLAQWPAPGRNWVLCWKLTSRMDCSAWGGLVVVPQFPSQISYEHRVRPRSYPGDRPLTNRMSHVIQVNVNSVRVYNSMSHRTLKTTPHASTYQPANTAKWDRLVRTILSTDMFFVWVCVCVGGGREQWKPGGACNYRCD